MHTLSELLSVLNMSLKSVAGTSNDVLYRILNAIEADPQFSYRVQVMASGVAYAISSGRVSGEIHQAIRRMKVWELISYVQAIHTLYPKENTIHNVPSIMSAAFYKENGLVVEIAYSSAKAAMARKRIAMDGKCVERNGNYVWCQNII